MKTKVIYVLVSQESDFYYEMFLLSHYSLRLYHPKGKVEVTLIMDSDTYQRLVEKKATILNDVTQVVVDVPREYTMIQRSRYLKTTLRQRVTGDFLFLDNDTIICGSLDEIDYTKATVAMVSNYNSSILLNDPNITKFCTQAGFSFLEGQPYYNSGVIYCKDAPDSYQLFEVWYNCWLTSIHNGIPQDQPALCQANKDVELIIDEMSGIWNCQYRCPSSKKYLKNAKILHYYGSSSGNNLILHCLFNNIREADGVTNPITRVVQKPRTIGISVLFCSMNNKRTLDYLFSDLLHVYDYTPPLFRLFISISRFFVKPIRFISKLKHLR